jgi:hypothetical protein
VERVCHLAHLLLA